MTQTNLMNSKCDLVWIHSVFFHNITHLLHTLTRWQIITRMDTHTDEQCVEARHERPMASPNYRLWVAVLWVTELALDGFCHAVKLFLSNTCGLLVAAVGGSERASCRLCANRAIFRCLRRDLDSDCGGPTSMDMWRTPDS